MTPETWWKNYALGMEIDAAGTFIYNGIKALHELNYLEHPIASFEVLYSLSVGIERLSKVAIILIEHSDYIDADEFEKSLISHDTIGLVNRISSKCNLQVCKVHKEFLCILSKFYKSHRYDRYSLTCVPDIYKEKHSFLEFIAKHLKTSFPIHDEFARIPNTDQIRKFIGKIVKRICDEIFKVVSEKAHELNIYTTEIREDSKALKVFYGKKLDFLDERLIKKELLLFLMNSKSHSQYMDWLRSYNSLELDPEYASYYVQSLINDSILSEAENEVEELYTEGINIRDRISSLEII